MEPQHTEEYWDDDVVARALEVGELFAATIRFNPHDASQAFVTVKGLPADVCVQVRTSIGPVLAAQALQKQSASHCPRTVALMPPVQGVLLSDRQAVPLPAFSKLACEAAPLHMGTV